MLRKLHEVRSHRPLLMLVAAELDPNPQVLSANLINGGQQTQRRHKLPQFSSHTTSPRVARYFPPSFFAICVLGITLIAIGIVSFPS